MPKKTKKTWKLAQAWEQEGFRPFSPKAEKRPFGYHATPPNEKTPPVVPCPNCDAPGQHNYWQHNGFNFYRPAADGYEVAHCAFCGAEVRMPGGYSTNPDKDAVWYYKPVPVPPMPYINLDDQLNAPVFFEKVWDNGDVVALGKDVWRSPYTLADLSDTAERRHLLVNAYTGGLKFVDGHGVTPWAAVRIRHVKASAELLHVGIWRPVDDYPDRVLDAAVYFPLSPLPQKNKIYVIEHDFLASDLPVPVQVKYIKNGLARTLQWDYPLVQAAAERYLQSLGVDPHDILREVKFERVRIENAKSKRQTPSAASVVPGQLGLF